MVAISRKAHEANLFAENGFFYICPKTEVNFIIFCPFLFEELAFEPQVKIPFCPLIVDGGFTNWGPWERCSSTCGVGSQFRFRTCTNPPPSNNGSDCVGRRNETQACNSGPCPGKEVNEALFWKGGLLGSQGDIKRVSTARK